MTHSCEYALPINIPRYFFTKNIGAYAEPGYNAVSVLSAGYSLTLAAKSSQKRGFLIDNPRLFAGEFAKFDNSGVNMPRAAVNQAA
jgi:hypothetical protein